MSIKAESNRWISVKERLPDEDVNVLCYSHGDYIEAYYCSVDKVFKPELDGVGTFENDVYTIDVTHWMPLPEKPSNQQKG